MFLRVQFPQFPLASDVPQEHPAGPAYQRFLLQQDVLQQQDFLASGRALQDIVRMMATCPRYASFGVVPETPMAIPSANDAFRRPPLATGNQRLSVARINSEIIGQQRAPIETIDLTGEDDENTGLEQDDLLITGSRPVNQKMIMRLEKEEIWRATMATYAQKRRSGAYKMWMEPGREALDAQRRREREEQLQARKAKKLQDRKEQRLAAQNEHKRRRSAEAPGSAQKRPVKRARVSKKAAEVAQIDDDDNGDLLEAAAAAAAAADAAAKDTIPKDDGDLLEAALYQGLEEEEEAAAVDTIVEDNDDLLEAALYRGLEEEGEGEGEDNDALLEEALLQGLDEGEKTKRAEEDSTSVQENSAWVDLAVGEDTSDEEYSDLF